MLSSILCDYSDAHMLMSGTITVAEIAAGEGNNNIQVVLQNCGPFIGYISEINNTQIDNARDIDVIMPMDNIIAYSNNYSKTSVSLWQYYRDESSLTDAGALDNVPGNSASFKFKQKVTSSTGDNGTKNVEIMVPS